MTALLSRRDDRCLSDLTMDRFLLGETVTTEVPSLERHLSQCGHCLARVQSLRALYSHADLPPSTEEPAPVPERPEHAPGASGVVEIVLLRDGLLVGTEVFTQGAWLIGSGPTSNLRLQSEGVAAEHARLFFRDGRVVVERLGGALLVNGYRVQRSEVRSIDELIVGPFVLRSRVITERWNEPVAGRAAVRLAAVDEAVTTELSELDGAFGPSQHTTVSVRSGKPDSRGSGPAEGRAVHRAHAVPHAPSPGGQGGSVRGEVPLRASANVASPTVAQGPSADGSGRGDARTGASSNASRQTVAEGPSAERQGSSGRGDAQARPQSPANHGEARERSRDRVHVTHEAIGVDGGVEVRPIAQPRVEQGALASEGPCSDSAASQRDGEARLAPTALRLDLRWGDALQSSTLVQAELQGGQFPSLGEHTVTARQHAGGFRLRVGEVPLERLGRDGHWIGVGAVADVVAGERVRARHGGLTLEARVQASPTPVPPRSKTEWLQGTFVPTLSFLTLGLLVFSGYASTMDRDDDDITSRPIPRLRVSMLPPPPPPVTVPTTPETPSTVKEPTRTPPRSRPPAPAAQTPPPHLKGLAGMTKVLDVAGRIARTLSSTRAVSGKGAPMFAGLGLPRGGSVGPGIGIGPSDAVGIGVRGLKGAGTLDVGQIGRRKVTEMTVDRGAMRVPAAAIDRDAVAKVIAAHLSEVSACYERALLTQSNLGGTLQYEWVIGASGQVASIKLKGGSLAGSSVAGCVSARIKTWAFPKPTGGQVTIGYPFAFRSSAY